MLSKQQQVYVDAIISSAPTVGLDCNTPTFTREQLRAVSMIHKGKKWIPNWITHDVSRRADRGVFTIPEVMEAMAVQPGHGIEGDELADTSTTTVMEQEDVMVTA